MNTDSDLEPALQNIRSTVAILHWIADIPYREKLRLKSEKDAEYMAKIKARHDAVKKRDEVVIKLREVDGFSFKAIAAHFHIKNPQSGRYIYANAKRRQRNGIKAVGFWLHNPHA